MDEPGEDEVFKALADPTRRALLDALVETDAQTLGALAARFPRVTRYAVMKHLRVLEGAGLVLTQRLGREKRHFLNPVPIAQIAARWIDKYAQPYAAALVGLKAGLEVAGASARPATPDCDTCPRPSPEEPTP